MTTLSEQAGPPQWTPGAGWERLQRELPHLVDYRKADELIAAAKRHDTKDRQAG
ncbi:hypothetical protein ACQP00_01465 [Dactylosporangium sp. CS-047395]|uniref:hypothetical protein n=1 Tax=Dactylosporangium sp. CS-047395 TaxID=3239936 RepID=UPI003D8DB877